MANSTKIFFFSRGITSNSYLFICYRIDHGSTPLSVRSIEYTHSSELHVTPPKTHVRVGDIPTRLNGMTVSYYESVK